MHVTRCGSTTHLKVTHRDCPLNPKRVVPDNTSASEDAPQRQKTQETQVDSDDEPLSTVFAGAASPFRYPLGTWVAFTFGGDTFAGTITKIYPGEDLCQVTFSDGDQGDYDSDEIQYAKELHEQRFPPDEE